MDPYIQAIKQAIAWEEEEALKKMKSYFPFFQNRQSFFPFMEEIKGIIKQEWQNTKKRFSFNRLHKLYPLQEADVDSFDFPQSGETAVVRLAKNVTLPMGDSSLL